MNQTPRTDAVITHFDLEEYCLADEARKLERELNDANRHIEELIFAGNALREWCEVLYDRNSTTTEQARLIKHDIKQWSQATQ
jgi:hypothetical protein